MASIFEYDQAAHEWALHEDGYDEGVEAGIQQGQIFGEKRTKLLDDKNLMETMTLTVEQAMDALKINDKKEREAIIKAVRG